MSMNAVELSLLLGRLRSICDEMGAVLIRSAHSPNIKERRDCSTALFDRDGELVMQAEHIPVHLGSMPDAVTAILEEDLRPGASWVLNDPYRGGTHLPDITLITPLHERGTVSGFAACRAHHADVGGASPGSMPADSTALDDEGIVIPPTRVEGPGDMEALTKGMRNRPQRIADMRAQWASTQIGQARFTDLTERYGGMDALGRATGEVLDYAERRTRAKLNDLPDGEWTAEDVLEGIDGDIRLRVRVRISGKAMAIDFDGSADQVEGNLNCPIAVTRSAALFATRVLLDPDAPPCAGSHRPIEIQAPLGSVLNARYPAAVAAGNVETSSRVADLVFGALAKPAGGPAQGQGTMNNLTLGSEGWTYYETMGGGQGACAEAPGPDAIHVAMSNTLNTPVEVLESELPLRVHEVSVRRGTGGSGEMRGGDGLAREIEALEPMQFSLISERRSHAPRGREGGGDGALGRNSLNGGALPPKATGELKAGDRLRIETPGGGGFGFPSA